MERLYDLLFEVSNEVRHQILTLLRDESLNLSQISRNLDLSLPEVSRHVSRLLEVEVLRKSLDGTYSLSSYGELVLDQIEEISFMSRNKDYFISHSLKLPREFVSRLGELSESNYAESMMNFLRFMEETVTDSDEYICARVAFPHKPGFSVDVSRNTIKCTKMNYGGMMIMGPFNVPEWAGKLGAGTVSENSIFLADGFVGIKVGRNNSIEVLDNVISGKAYYGIRVHGRDKPQDTTVFAEGNVITDNDMTGLEIKSPDDYSNKNADEFMFAGTQGSSETGHVWLDSLTKGNVVEAMKGEKVVDEGQDNKISYTDP